MAKKNIYLLLILTTFFITVVADSLSKTLDRQVSLNSAVGGVLIFFFIYAWCVEHAKHYGIKIPSKSAFWAALIAPIGVPLYFFRGFGFKEGLLKTVKSIVFLMIISIDAIFALWVADDPMFYTPNEASAYSEVSNGFNAFDDENYEIAFDKLKDLADLDNADAQGRVAWMYYNGKGVAQNSNKALIWYAKAAEQGDAVSQNNLAMFYRAGEIVEQDYRKALKWFQISSEQGYSYAQVNLGDMYASGDGIEVSLERARYWFKKAADNGSVEAKELLKLLENL